MGIEKQYFTQDTPQPRMEWYLVGRAASGLIRAGERSGINPKDLIYIGGFATYLHLRSVVGDMAVTHWRGTKDVDLMVFERGGGKRLIKGIERRGNYGDAEIKYKQSHFVDKDSFEVVFPTQGYLKEEAAKVDLDVYSPQKDSRYIHMNERQLARFPEPFLSSKVETYVIKDQGHPVEVSVPSIADCMILKLDVVNYSKNNNLRDKDKSDLLTLLYVAEAKGMDATVLIREVFSYIGGAIQSKTAEQLLGAINLIDSKKRQDLKKQGVLLFEPSKTYADAARSFLSKKIRNHN